MGLLRQLRPKWWFGAHLHARPEAVVRHEPLEGTQELTEEPKKVENPDEIVNADSDFDAPTPRPPNLQKRHCRPQNLLLLLLHRYQHSDEITLDDDELDVVAPPPPAARPKTPSFTCEVSGDETRFLAQKNACSGAIPSRRASFLPSIHCACPNFVSFRSFTSLSPVLSFDPEWLAIARVLNTHMRSSACKTPIRAR